MKKLFALLLAVIMVMSLATTAFAAEHNHTITINNKYGAGYTYQAYQVFSGDLGADGVLSNIAWGSGVDGEALLAELKTLDAFKDCDDAKEVAHALTDNTFDDAETKTFAAIVAKHLTSTVAGTSTYDEGTKVYTISGLNDGYYLVVNTAVPGDGSDETIYSRYMLEVVRDVTVTHKGDIPKVEKSIIVQELELEDNQQPIGGVETYKITGTMPSNIADYKTYYYSFIDTLSKGLTYNNDIKVTVNGVDATSLFTVTAVPEADGPTLITITAADLKAAANTAVYGAVTADTKVVVTYTATVNENALVAVEGNPNKVKLEYDNNPNDDGDGTKGTTPEDEVRTWVTELTIYKKDGQGNTLTGAEFTLTGESVKTMIVSGAEYRAAQDGETAVYYELNDGTFTKTAPTQLTIGAYKSSEPTHVLADKEEVITKSETVAVKGYVGEDGLLTFTGLGAGTYTLTETVTPTGYNTMKPITFTVSFDRTTKQFSTNSNQIYVSTTTPNTLYGEIINEAGTTLPATGGMGTTIFYILGGLMVTGAAVLLITKKRMSFEA